MDWFFDNIVGETHLITGEDANHITKSLRLSVGEMLTLCDKNRIEHLCVIERITNEGVLVRCTSEKECQNEANTEITLFAALTKGDKLENVIQKSIELGVHRIVPTLTDRCISRPDKKAAEKKLLRYQKIAAAAAMQSRRAYIPEVAPVVGLDKAAAMLPDFELCILFYEGGGATLRELISPVPKSIAIFTGPEGGFEEREVELLTKSGAKRATLGKRILRAETAPLAAISALMYATGNLE